MMKVKGEALISIPIFILKKIGKRGFNEWLNEISPEARTVYSTHIKKNDWFPLKEIMIEPSKKACELFFHGSKRGAWECGRYSAEYGLKGIYKVLVKLSSPQILIKKAGPILNSYYKPSSVEVVEKGDNYVILHITEFTEMDKMIEYRIAGWMERALEICGCKHISIRINKSLTENDPYSEYNISWKKKL
ncbi:hypothetical protein ACFL50_03870 [Candidatus Latescibacterota bacterium]